MPLTKKAANELKGKPVNVLTHNGLVMANTQIVATESGCVVLEWRSRGRAVIRLSSIARVVELPERAPGGPTRGAGRWSG